MLMIENQEPSNWIEIQNNENQKKNKQTNQKTKPVCPNTSKQMLTWEDKINVEWIKKIMTEKKTTLRSLRNQDRKKNQGRNWKDKQIITKYPNRQDHWIKWTNLCWSEFSQW